ncbi:MAG: arginine--tRNA ligase [bacterium]|nr:arginine--tRNA ligase [bacterium]
MYTIQKLEQAVLQAVKAATGRQYTPGVEEITEPPDSKWGDVAFPCFLLSKELGRPPVEIAAELAPKIPRKGYIQSAEARGPYINIFFDPIAVAKETLAEISEMGAQFGTWETGAKKKVMVEYAQLNTHKATHVGHVRNMVLGRAVVNLLRSLGYEVITAGFHGDVGTHVATTLWGLEKFHKDEEPPAKGRGLWLNRIYSEAVKYLEEHPEKKADMLALNKKFEAGDRALKKIWKQTRSWSIKELDQVFKELKVELDRRYYESEMEAPARVIVEDLLKRALAVKSEGAIIVPLDAYGLGAFLILKSDGSTLYATRDLALAQKKFEEYPLDRSIHAVDSRQSLHFQQLFKTLELMGFKKPMEHVPYEFVTLKGGALSSRKGNIVSYEEFRDAVMMAASQETKARHEKWSERKIKNASWAITEAAIKFSMLLPDVNRAIVFDVGTAISFDGATGPYIQYTGARINSILRKAASTLKPFDGILPQELNQKEKELLMMLARYPRVVLASGTAMRPAPLAEYLFHLAKKFAEFYETVSVLKASPSEKTFRLGLIGAIRSVLENGVALLGFSLPKEM